MTDNIKKFLEADALLPCPFCGFDQPLIGEDFNEDTGFNGWGVRCGNPDCRGVIEDVYKERKFAIEAWNTRIAPDIRALQNALEQVCGRMQEHADTLESWVNAVPEQITKMMAEEIRQSLIDAAPFRKTGV